MKNVMTLAAVAALALSPVVIASAAIADDHGHAAMEAAAPVEYTLEDGVTKVSVEGDSVFVIGTGNTKTPAPDGVHKTNDGKTLTTKDGKVVADEAAKTE